MIHVYLKSPEGVQPERTHVCDITYENEILDAVLRAYPDGNYDYWDEDEQHYVCHRDNGEQFFLTTSHFVP